MIRVCDAIMGQGKTEAAISYMNEHPNRKFIYITPYLPEATRIRKSCPALGFVEPEEKYLYKEDCEDDEKWRAFEVAKRTKTMHTAELISNGRNVATTHQAFMYYTPEMLRQIRDQHYTLVIDEDLQTVSQFAARVDDLQLGIDGGLLNMQDNIITLTDWGRENYRCGIFYGMVRLLRSRVLEKVADSKTEATMVFWMLTAELLEAFDDVFVLTYLFEGQSLYNMLRMNGMPYEYIGVRHDDDGYHFSDDVTGVPEFARHLKEKIHIEQSDKLNDIGDNRCALSVTWLTQNADKRERLKKNIYNYLHNIAPGSGEQIMWTTFKRHKTKFAGPGYKKRFVVMNKKATNDYSTANSLVYAANVFMHPAYKAYYAQHGIEVNEDQYALSTMIQWIWRSAIRVGEDIWIYIPSRRMRTLLENWLDDLARGR